MAVELFFLQQTIAEREAGGKGTMRGINTIRYTKTYIFTYKKNGIVYKSAKL